MRLLLRHKLLVALTALVVVGAAGGAYAATQSGTNPQQAFINDAAKRLNVSPSRLNSALKGALVDRIQAAVKAGQLTQTQANRIEQLIQSGKLPALGDGFFGGPHGFLRGPYQIKVGGPLHAVAGYLGLSEPQLLNDLRSGKSLAQLAQAHNKSVSGLEQLITSTEKARLDRLLTAGFITKAQEQRLLSRLSARVGKLVNHGGFPMWRMRPGLKMRPDLPGAGPAIQVVPGGAGVAVPGGPPGPPPPGAGPMLPPA